ncbi:MAG TPA: ABC-2 family transporter protein, partial [Thermomicrobiales bacterium]|nr:ABC-2 family transporter protein [Thermomicrobiales bacterium]
MTLSYLQRNRIAFAEYVRMTMRRVYIYRVNVVMGMLLTGITIYLLTILWKAAYGDRTSVGGVSIDQMLVYLTIANLQLRFLAPQLDQDIEERIREGQIGFDLNRPLSYPFQLVAGAAGQMVGLIPMIVLALPIAFVFGELRAPTSVSNGIAYAVSLALAWIVAVELNMVIGLVSFWTLEMTGFRMMYNLVSNFATGALIPLWFMPDLLRIVIQVLPFQSIAYIPVSIYIGNPATGHIWSALLIQVVWMG